MNPLKEIMGSAFTAALDAIMDKLFADYSAEDLEFAVERDISLLRIIEMGILDYKDNGENWKPENKRRYKHFIAALKFGISIGKRVPTLIDNALTEEAALDYMERKRPDLYEILASPEGQKWLSVSFPEIKMLLEGKIQIDMGLVEE